MSSLFVSKAAFIAKRKLEQKQKKMSPVKEEPKAVPDKPNEDPETEKKVRGEVVQIINRKGTKDYIPLSRN